MKLTILTLCLLQTLAFASDSKLKKDSSYNCFISKNDLESLTQKKLLDEKSAKRITDETGKLGLQLLSAILNDDKDAFIKCFMSQKDLENIVQKSGMDEKCAKRSAQKHNELLEKIPQYFTEARKLIKQYKLTKDNVKAKAIEVNLSHAGQDQFRISWMKIIFVAANKKYMVHMDDGFKFGTHWKFTDKMKQNIKELKRNQ